MTRYKVSKNGMRWKYGFRKLSDACKYAERRFAITGVVAAVEVYEHRKKKHAPSTI